MTSMRYGARSAVLLLAMLALGGCGAPKDMGYQGWVEADLISSARTSRAGGPS